MFSRTFKAPRDKSFFLFGPRGTGKSFWARDTFPEAVYLDLLESDLYAQLLASPARLESFLPEGFRGTVVLDEVQKVPGILDEVHRLIERRRLRFVLTGSSARKLRRKGVNLLAGRALTHFMHPLTADELGAKFDLSHALEYGCLPAAWVEEDPKAYLQSYIVTYLKEEVQQEGLTRNLASFARFLEAASFSQGGVLNVSQVARECSVERKVVENYFGILEDLLLAVRLPVFAKRARRDLVAHQKFYLFDAGVYRAVRPRGPLDAPQEIGGIAAETLLFQHLRAVNDNARLGYSLHYWRTRSGLEVDFVLYGERGLRAFEVKSAPTVRSQDLHGLQAFLSDYPMARAWLLYGGRRAYREGSISVLPFADGLRSLGELL